MLSIVGFLTIFSYFLLFLISDNECFFDFLFFPSLGIDLNLVMETYDVYFILFGIFLFGC